MKNLEEKKLLVKMARAFGQPVDPALLESIEKEERLAKLLFKEEVKEPEPEIIVEEPPPPPAPAFTPPVTDTVQQVKNVLDTVPSVPSPPSVASTLANKELESIKKTLSQVLSKMSTMTWGGGGTGIVRLWNADDLQRQTVTNNAVVKYRTDGDGWFYFETVTGLESFTYGSFSDTTNQTANTANTPYEMRFNTTDYAKGHYIRNQTEVVANTTGLYNYQFSAQLYSTSASQQRMWIWIRKNNQDVPNTATLITTSENKQYSVAAWNYFVDMNAGDHLHLMWAVDDTRLSIASPGPTAFCPGIPSVILTVSSVST